MASPASVLSEGEIVPGQAVLSRSGLLRRRMQLGKYQLGRTLGQGIQGKVVVAKANGEEFAAKRLPADRGQQALSEAHMQTQCHDHPNIATVADVVDTGRGGTFLIMQKADNGDLFQRVVEDGPLDVREFKSLIRQLVAAVQHMHSKGVAHCDIKPENILLTNKGDTLLLADFGKAIACQPGTLVRTTAPGTIRCLPPEIFSPSKSDLERGDNMRTYNAMALDVWAIGVVAFFMVAGEFPFEGRNDHQTAHNIVHSHFACGVPHTLPEDANAFIAKLLQPDPRQRPSIREVAMHPFLTNARAFFST